MTVKVKCKGTVLAVDLADTSYAAVAQVIDIDLPDMEMETFEADTLDNESAGIPYFATGRTEGGSFSANIFYDPKDTSHIDWASYLSTTGIIDGPTPAFEVKAKITFANVAIASFWTFTLAGINMGGAVALGDGLKVSIGGKLNGIPTFTSSV